MNALLFVAVVALCAQATICAGPNKFYDFGGIYDNITADTATTLNQIQSQIDVTSINRKIADSAAAGKAAINAFYTKTVDQLQPDKQKSIANYVATVQATQKPATCKTDYTSAVAFFTKYYAANVVNCLNLRFALPLLESGESLRAYVASEATNLYDDLSTATDGGLALAPGLVNAGGDQLSKTIDATVELSWTRQALSYLICLTANDAQAKQAKDIVINKITNCQ